MLEMLPQWLIDWLGPDGIASLAYITNGKHLSWYASVRYTLLAACFGAILAVVFGLLGAAAKLSKFAPLRWIGDIYTTMVRGVPDVLFLLFFPLAFEQGVEYLMAKLYCKPEEIAAATGWPLCQSAQWYLSTTEYMVLACFSLGIVYGAFAANVIYGALKAVPKGQLEAAHAFGFPSREVFWRFQVRQMWVYALPGLSNVWLLLLKATSLLSLLQITDIVAWADRLGAPNYSPLAGLVHADWRWKYYLVLFIFYILLTWFSEKFFAYLQARAGRGMARAN
ncbi:ABC transporter permease subunit [uncultured Thiothrix sp.]|uniref:ABC transporter permease subunit n=1 Tax=uncultured Thiothrix sp. TaxID=223185 RepID=UPI0026071892|nr:ABC transporter permease subunit [uncultured Thiothrix sp.]